jgi:hypothetical protein
MATTKSKNLQGSFIGREEFSFDKMIESNRDKVDFDQMFASWVEGDPQGRLDFQTEPEPAKAFKGGES